MYSDERGTGWNSVELFRASGPAGADARFLVSAISRGDVLFRTHIAESILSCALPFHHSVFRPAELPLVRIRTRAFTCRWHRHSCLCSPDTARSGCVTSAHGPAGLSSTCEKSLREIADFKEPKSAPAGAHHRHMNNGCKAVAAATAPQDGFLRRRQLANLLRSRPEL
jgi:hypothetical protein